MNKKWILLIFIAGVVGTDTYIRYKKARMMPAPEETSKEALSNMNDPSFKGGARDALTDKGAGHTTSTDKNCFAYEYRHKKEAQARDIEDFLDFTNAFSIAHANVNTKSICVKVNNKPVVFKVAKNEGRQEVVIGAVVGPESVIRVSYCVGTALCKEACTVKTNRYMDDLMSDASADDDIKESWDADSEKELKGKVKELRNVASENGDLGKHMVMRAWDNLQKQETVCLKK